MGLLASKNKKAAVAQQPPLLARISQNLQRISVSRDKRLAKRLDSKLAQVVQARAQEENAVKVRFNRMLLKFPEMHRGFVKARAVFESAGAEEGRLPVEHLKAAVAKLGFSLDQETLDELVAAEDSDKDNSLGMDECIVVAAICHLLKKPEDAGPADPEINNAFQIAEQAFLCFDSTKRGYIDSTELARCMHETRVDLLRRSPGHRGIDPELRTSSARFAELDKDGDGKTTFREFLFRLERWVEEAESEVDDDDDEEGR